MLYFEDFEAGASRSAGGYALHDGHIVAVNDPDGTDAHHASINEELTEATWDISITKNVMSLLVSAALLLLIFISVAKAYTRRAGQAPNAASARPSGADRGRNAASARYTAPAISGSSSSVPISSSAIAA